MKLKDKIKTARLRKNLTRNALNTAAGLATGTIYRLESGRRTGMVPETAQKLAAVLDVQASYLLGLK